MLSKNPKKVHSVKVEPILRQGIERYLDQVGQLWNSLASYYIGLGNFERVSILSVDSRRALWKSFQIFLIRFMRKGQRHL